MNQIDKEEARSAVMSVTIKAVSMCLLTMSRLESPAGSTLRERLSPSGHVSCQNWSVTSNKSMSLLVPWGVSSVMLIQ